MRAEGWLRPGEPQCLHGVRRSGSGGHRVQEKADKCFVNSKKSK